MSIYSSNGLEKNLPPKSRVEPDVVVEDDDDDDDDDDDEEEEEEEDDDEDDDEDEDYEVEKEDGGDDDPFFISVISKSHNTMLRLPTDFVRLARIEAKRTIILKNLEGKEWQMGMGLDRGNLTTRFYLSAGWLDFKRSNGLSEGNECVFKFIRSENKMCLAKVTKATTGSNQNPATEIPKKSKGRPPLYNHGGGVVVKQQGECVEVAKRPRGRPRKQPHGRAPK